MGEITFDLVEISCTNYYKKKKKGEEKKKTRWMEHAERLKDNNKNGEQIEKAGIKFKE